jgi:ribose transport system substrate-binding protein
MTVKRLFLLVTMILLFVGMVACSAETGKQADGGKSDGKGDSKKEFADLYAELPFTDILPLDDGPILIKGKEKKIKIGFSQTGFNHPWRVEMINAAKAEVERHSNVSIIVTDGNVDVVKQGNDIDDLIAQGVDVIVLSPVESDGLVTATKRAIKAGIPVIVLDRDVFTDKTLFMGQSNFSLGQRVADELVKKLNGKGNVLEITGLLGSSPAIDRHDGFMSIIKKYPDIKVLQQGDGQWIREPAVKLMEDWLTAFGKNQIDAVFSHAEESSWGASLAIQRANRQGDGILHYTMDGSNEGFRSVKNGEFEADGNYTPYIGQLGIRAALYTLMGKEIGGKEKYKYGEQITIPDLPVVVKGNADEWIGKGWGE